MSDEFNKSGCTPSDCASCTANCESKVDEAHHTITLTMDDDTEVECAILTIFPVENKEYIALLPLDENGQNETGEVYLYSFSRTADGDPMLANIEDDEEYDAVANAESSNYTKQARKIGCMWSSHLRLPGFCFILWCFRNHRFLLHLHHHPR